MKGWKYEGYRHSLAAKGIKTSFSKKRNNCAASAVAATALIGYLSELEQRKTAKAQTKQQLKVVRADKDLERERQHTARMMTSGGKKSRVEEVLSDVLFPEPEMVEVVYLPDEENIIYEVEQ